MATEPRPQQRCCQCPCAGGSARKRCTDGALDVEQLARTGGEADRVRWTSLNRIAFGHLAGRRVTVDGGELVVHADLVKARVRASGRTWAAMTIAVDGHLPADPQACLRAVLDDRAGGTVVPRRMRVRPSLTSTEEDRHG